MDIRRYIGRAVRKLREERGWSQEELAYRADVHRTYVSGLENGARNPTVTVIAKFAKALGVPANALLPDR